MADRDEDRRRSDDSRSSPVSTSFRRTPLTPSFWVAVDLSIAEFQMKSILGFLCARSCMIFEARSSSRRWTTIDLGREAGEEGRLLHRGVAAADHDHFLVLEECAVAGRACADAIAHQPLFGFDAEQLRGRAGRDDQRLAPDRSSCSTIDLERPFAQVELRSTCAGDELGAEALGLVRKISIISGPWMPFSKPG